MLFNSSESIDFLITSLIIYFFFECLKFVAPKFVADIPQVWFTVGAVVMLFIIVQIGSLPFIRSNLFRFIFAGDEVQIRYNEGASFDNKNFVLKDGSISSIYKGIAPENFASYFLLDTEKYWLATVKSVTGDDLTVPLDFVYKIRS